jgi:hypothetical protein
MEAKLSTLDEETTLLTGGDMEKNLPRIAQEIKMLDKIGLKHPAEGSSQPAVGAIAPMTPPDNMGNDGTGDNNGGTTVIPKKNAKSR